MAKRDYYEVLGVNRDASEQDIKRSYRRLAMKWHPDRNPDDADAETKFKEASEAAEVLLDTEKRAAYDQFGHAAVDGSAGAGGFGGGFGGGSFSSIFEDVFTQLKFISPKEEFIAFANLLTWLDRTALRSI